MADEHRVRKAVIPAAGMGTRFLPATKSIPKEMLPIVDKPVIQFVVEEAIASGITDILIITGRNKRAIEDHFDRNTELEQFLERRSKHDALPQIRMAGDDCRIFYARQAEPHGLGDAVSVARDHVGDEPFAVLLGDTIIDPDDGALPGLRQLIDVHTRHGGSVVSVRDVPREWTSRYGIVDGQPVEGEDRLTRISRLIEKPDPDDAPTTLAIAGRYVFTPDIFDLLDQTAAGVGGEIQLTDAMNALAAMQPMHGLKWRAKRYDIGSKEDYVNCFIDFALRHADTADVVRGRLGT